MPQRVKSLPHVELFRCDWKETDDQKHIDFTGVSNKTIRENLLRLSAEGAKIRLCCPIVPGFNDRDDHFAGIADLSRRIADLDGVDLLPYHRLGESKLERFGMEEARRARVEPVPAEAVDQWINRLEALGANGER